MNKNTTEGLGCNFFCALEYEKHNPLGRSIDTEKALFLFRRLIALEKSDTVFKHIILSYIDLLQKGIGRVYLSDHSRTLNTDLSVTNAQSIRFECLNQPLHVFASIPQGAEDYAPQLFLFMRRIPLLIRRLYKTYVVQETLASTQIFCLLVLVFFKGFL